jgi:hypothetical protein
MMSAWIDELKSLLVALQEAIDTPMMSLTYFTLIFVEE